MSYQSSLNLIKGMPMVKNVLLVDDDPISIVVTKSLIHNSKVAKKIMSAPNGREGISILKNCIRKNEFPELIFLDLKMPVMDGYQFLNEMKGIGKSKIVILANSIKKQDLELENSYDIIDFLIKPISLNNIQEIFASPKILQ